MAVRVPRGAGENGTRTEEKVAQAVEHLGKALELLDESDAPRQLGARLQQTIDAVEEWRSA